MSETGKCECGHEKSIHTRTLCLSTAFMGSACQCTGGFTPESPTKAQNDSTLTLRDRIAAVIYEKVSGWDDFPFDQLTQTSKALFLEQADAVIAELNLTTPVDYPSVDKTRHNYIVAGHFTTAEADDE